MKSLSEVERQLREEGTLERFKPLEAGENPVELLRSQTGDSSSEDSDYEPPQKQAHKDNNNETSMFIAAFVLISRLPKPFVLPHCF